MILRICQSWNEFWFAARSTGNVVLLRIAICLVTALWFASFWGDLQGWFGASGILSREVSARLLEFEESASWQNWSPLWFTDSEGLCLVWLSIGVLISVLAGLGVGGRITILVLLILVVAWAHRISWLQGPVEPALVACIAYLLIEPGPKLWRLSEPAETWTAGLSTRLFQTHWWILVAAGTLSQLASVIWWRGEGVWWLASAGRSNLFTVEFLNGQASLINALSHSVIVIELLALWTVTLRVTRPLGCVLGLAVSMIYAGVADQLLYGLLLAACLIAFNERALWNRQAIVDLASRRK